MRETVNVNNLISQAGVCVCDYIKCAVGGETNRKLTEHDLV